ncbi:MAG: hypothetical protein IT195_08080 [Microthrixaceae bacterium]|nr:hypothetical protein [Microthrixaceae bacterium]
MLIALWSVKGGSGVTAVSIGIAARRAGKGEQVLLVDLGGDLPAALGSADPTVGVRDWLRSEAEPSALRRIEVATPSAALSLLPVGRGSVDFEQRRCELFAAALSADTRTVVVDIGTLGTDPQLDRLRTAVIDSATRSVLVTRPCYLALRRVVGRGISPDGVVLVREVGRALDASDVERLVGAPVIAQVDVDPAVARMVDSGLLVHRAPRSFTKPLGRVA